MQHIRYLLLPDEKVLFEGRIHPVVYAPGLILIALAIATMYFLPQWIDASPFLSLQMARLARWYPALQHLVPGVAGLLFVMGVAKIFTSYFTIFSTELVVTDRRVIAKIGITTTTTVEMDRFKIAGVVITQSLPGEWMDYGWVTLQGFSGNVIRFPVLAHPKELQKQIHSRYVL